MVSGAGHHLKFCQPNIYRSYFLFPVLNFYKSFVVANLIRTNHSVLPNTFCGYVWAYATMLATEKAYVQCHFHKRCNKVPAFTNGGTQKERSK